MEQPPKFESGETTLIQKFRKKIEEKWSDMDSEMQDLFPGDKGASGLPMLQFQSSFFDDNSNCVCETHVGELFEYGADIDGSVDAHYEYNGNKILAKLTDDDIVFEEEFKQDFERKDEVREKIQKYLKGILSREA